MMSARTIAHTVESLGEKPMTADRKGEDLTRRLEEWSTRFQSLVAAGYREDGFQIEGTPKVSHQWSSEVELLETLEDLWLEATDHLQASGAPSGQTEALRNTLSRTLEYGSKECWVFFSQDALDHLRVRRPILREHELHDLENLYARILHEYRSMSAPDPKALQRSIQAAAEASKKGLNPGSPNHARTPER